MTAPSAGRGVCVYCASSTYDPALLEIATEVGAGIARRGWSLVSGGGNVSMMGAVAEAARHGGARTVGVIPEGLRVREVADTSADELVVVTTMRERKREMEERSDAFLTLPGGIGTMEEMFEVWTSASLGFHDKPVVLYDPIGFYRPLLDWVGGLAESGLVKPEALECLVVRDDLESALDACGGAR
ncbi:TIGR00730 family Rossman fold protein [Dietzia sp. PP-33]|uniref:LOG family protein n=1 Tax=Dietzia sp. PP-33 TaxID=2957500 RepID=UPI0029BE8BED|nr:TIGR00730 family Rossman fold protein [Dietzia sp. PP-33]MDX2355777.1 TIGR00730 family Rossman fold protein [Dietzia sp. PP-33]